MIVVCDSSVLIGLTKIGKLDLLREVFPKVCIPEAVFHEVVVKGAHKTGSEVLKEARWIETVPVKDRTQVGFLKVSLDIGEAEVLALAKELRADLVLVDEAKAPLITPLPTPGTPSKSTDLNQFYTRVKFFGL